MRILVVASWLLICFGGLPGCAYLGVFPDEGARAYGTEPRLDAPAFETAAVVVNGGYMGGLREPGVARDAERQAWQCIRDALEDKRLARRVVGAGAPGRLKILFEFVLEDDIHPLHRGFSRLTLFAFPEWKMLRCSARAHCQVNGEFLPEFAFEEEVLIYKSPVLLPFAPFNIEDPVHRLLTAAGRSLAMHVLEWTGREFPTRLQRHAAPGAARSPDAPASPGVPASAGAPAHD